MKRVTMKAVVNTDLCIGCKICTKVCPVCAIEVTDRKAHSDEAKCMACANCADRCPRHAIQMVEREDVRDVGVDVSKFDYAQIRALCEKAHLNPEQIICYCTATRAEEVAACLLDGATTPEEVSLRTGMRTACTIECIQPLLRLIQAAGLELHPDPNAWRWYGPTITAWELPREVIDKYNDRGFYFDEDKALLDRITKVGAED